MDIARENIGGGGAVRPLPPYRIIKEKNMNKERRKFGKC